MNENFDTTRCFYTPNPDVPLQEDYKKIADGLFGMINKICEDQRDNRRHLLNQCGSDGCASAVINHVGYKTDGFLFSWVFEWSDKARTLDDQFEKGYYENPLLGVRAYNDPTKPFLISSCVLTREEMLQVLDERRTKFVSSREGRMQ